METPQFKRKEEQRAFEQSKKESFLHAIGEGNRIVKQQKVEKKKQEEADFLKRTREDHERKVKITLEAMRVKKSLLLPSESIFGAIIRKKKKKTDEDEPGKKDVEKLGEEKERPEEKEK
jgi:hypothetical protein